MKLKKFIFWTLGISLASLIIGLVIMAYQGSYKIESRIIDQSKTAGVEGINNIKIQSSSADIIITPTAEKEITLRYYGTLRSSGKDDPKVEINKIGNDLKIKSGMNLGFIWYSATNFEDFKLEVKLPASYQNKLEIVTNFGDIEVSSLKLADLTTSTGSKGKVTITDCQGDQEVNATLGEITITDTELNSNKTIKSTFSDVNLILPANGDFTFIYDTNSGNLTNLSSAQITQNSKEHILGTAGSGNHTITVKTSSGNLNLTKSN